MSFAAGVLTFVRRRTLNFDGESTQFNAAVQAEGGDGDFAASMGIVSGAVLALDFTLGLINPVAAKAAKTGIIVAFSSAMGFSVLGGVVATGFDDLAESHMMPLYRKNLEQWFGKASSYTRISGGEWTELRKEKHPVRKNGLFDFEPRKYG